MKYVLLIWAWMMSFIITIAFLIIGIPNVWKVSGLILGILSFIIARCANRIIDDMKPSVDEVRKDSQEDREGSPEGDEPST